VLSAELNNAAFPDGGRALGASANVFTFLVIGHPGQYLVTRNKCAFLLTLHLVISITD
jgi:hypothetical protein